MNYNEALNELKKKLEIYSEDIQLSIDEIREGLDQIEKNRGFYKELPYPRQMPFVFSQEKEIFYGGAAGGGKSSALLMAALLYVDRPNYKALILRRTYPNLVQPGGLIFRSKEWLYKTKAKWNEQRKEWKFPSGAVLKFGHLQTESDMYNYQGSEYHFIGFDELTEFDEKQYRFLYRSLRKAEDDPIPLRMRSTGNPGGIGHKWVKARFIDGDKPFIPASWQHNPYLDKTYKKYLDNLDPLHRAFLRDGDWNATISGGVIKRDWFDIIDDVSDIEFVAKCRFWDLAATKPEEASDPDYTVGLLMGVDADGHYYVLDVKRGRWSPSETEKIIKRTAEEDGRDTLIRMEQEPGASGKMTIEYFERLLQGYDFQGVASAKNKYERARGAIASAEQGRFHVLSAPWLPAFLDELEAFGTETTHDDQVDAWSGAFNTLVEEAEFLRSIRMFTEHL